jgi:hypothetical protein
MIPHNLFAYTAPGADSPEYLSINLVGGKIIVTVRASKADGGQQAAMELPESQWRELASSYVAT